MDRERREVNMEVQFMTIEEASSFLNLKVSKLRRDVFMKVIPYYKFGSLIRFKKDELLKWVEEKVVIPASMSNLRPQS